MFTVHKNIKVSSASNVLVVQYQILFILENIDNTISYQASQVVFS